MALCLASNFQQFGIQYTTVGKAGFITACYIVIVPVLGLLLGKKCSPVVAGAVVLSLAGLYMLCMKGGELSVNKGDLLMLVCAFLFAVHIMIIDFFSPVVDGVKMSCIQFFVSGILSGAAMLIYETPEWSQIIAAWAPVLYAGIMSCGVAYTLQIVGQKGMNPTVASLILSLESSISVLAGWAILGQRLSSKEVLAAPYVWRHHTGADSGGTPQASLSEYGGKLEGPVQKKTGVTEGSWCYRMQSIRNQSTRNQPIIQKPAKRIPVAS